MLANIKTVDILPSDLIDGEVVYYTIKHDCPHTGHGPFTIRVLDGIIHLENGSGFLLPLSKFGHDVIELKRPAIK